MQKAFIMKRFLPILFVLIAAATITVSGQQPEIYLPREYRVALKKQTRSESGAPGINYFQNQADYSITASFDPASRKLTGHSLVTYYNNSPDTMRIIVLNTDHDFFKRGSGRSFGIDPSDLTDGIDIRSLKVSGKEITLAPPVWRRNGTQAQFRLPSALAPGTSVEFEMEWSLIHPAKTWIRTGTYDSTSFFIAYWFPRVAVYDDIFGWDVSGHLGTAEFYNDFGDFDVKLTIPGHYMIWATGELQNQERIFSETILDRLENNKENETIKISSSAELMEGKVLKSASEHTWHFWAEMVPDFAFGLSDTYNWVRRNLRQSDGKLIRVNAVYPDKAEDFREVAEIGATTIKMMSEEITGVSYPFPEMTVFCGHGGMEFPMMANDGSSETREGTVFVTSHEISHSWFPFLAGLNETRYGWMDEGLITYLPKKVEEYYFPERNPHLSYISSYANWAGREDDLNMSVPSNSIANHSSYMMNAYGRSAVTLMHLEKLIGAEKFKTVLKTFLEEWRFKHPSPYDFIITCERVAGEDLDWYFGSWLFGYGYPDLVIREVSNPDYGAKITIAKAGYLPMPVHLICRFDDGSEHAYSEPVSVWKDGRTLHTVETGVQKKLKWVKLGNELIPDTYPGNNVWESADGNGRIPPGNGR
jgi:hypothetical protein